MSPNAKLAKKMIRQAVREFGPLSRTALSIKLLTLCHPSEDVRSAANCAGVSVGTITERVRSWAWDTANLSTVGGTEYRHDMIRAVAVSPGVTASAEGVHRDFIEQPRAGHCPRCSLCSGPVWAGEEVTRQDGPHAQCFRHYFNAYTRRPLAWYTEVGILNKSRISVKTILQEHTRMDAQVNVNIVAPPKPAEKPFADFGIGDFLVGAISGALYVKVGEFATKLLADPQNRMHRPVGHVYHMCSVVARYIVPASVDITVTL